MKITKITKENLKSIKGGRPTVKQYIEMGCTMGDNGRWYCPL